MLCTFGHSVATCCDTLGVVRSNLTVSKLEPPCRNTSQQSGQTRTMLHYVALKYCNRLAGAQLKPYLDLKGKASVNIHCKPYSYLAIRSLITIPSQLRKLPKHIVVILTELRSELKRKTQLICATTDTFQFNNFNPISFFFLVQSSACYRWLRPTSSLFCKFLHWSW